MENKEKERKEKRKYAYECLVLRVNIWSYKRTFFRKHCCQMSNDHIVSPWALNDIQLSVLRIQEEKGKYGVSTSL